jgi:hypothetical protein
MKKITKQDILTFNQEFENCVEQADDGQVAIDSFRLRQLVSLKQSAAWGFVELYCSMATNQPAYLMTALIVALVYQMEYGDNTLENLVLERANALDAMKYLLSIRTLL